MPLGLQAVEENTGGKVVSPRYRLSILLRKYSWYSFLLEAETTAHSAAAKIKPMKDADYPIGNRVRELTAFGAMPQPTTACPLSKNKRMSKSYLIIRSHEEVSTNSAKTACIKNIGTILYLHSRTLTGKQTYERWHMLMQRVIFISQKQDECYGYPKTWRRNAEMPEGVSTLIFVPLAFCITFTVKTFFKFIPIQKIRLKSSERNTKVTAISNLYKADLTKQM